MVASRPRRKCKPHTRRLIQHPDQAVRKEKVLEDLFNAVDTPYWRLKKVMDAWCALWFWPAERAGLLDGTDGEYTTRGAVGSADSLSELLGGVPLTVGVGVGAWQPRNLNEPMRVPQLLSAVVE